MDISTACQLLQQYSKSAFISCIVFLYGYPQPIEEKYRLAHARILSVLIRH